MFLTLLYLETGVCARRLHDAMFGRVPILSAFLRWTGGVRGTKNIAEKLMADGQPLLFYPGGLEESFKAPGTPTYGLKWGERLGFIMLAIKHECEKGGREGGGEGMRRRSLSVYGGHRGSLSHFFLLRLPHPHCGPLRCFSDHRSAVAT